MNWLFLTTTQQFDDMVSKSTTAPVAIYKHSTRCSTCILLKRVIERDWESVHPTLPIYYLDLLAYRPVSDYIASQLSIAHESPQVIVLKDGKAVYHASHAEIDIAAINA